MIKIDAGRFMVKLADSEDEILAAQRLRYRIFVDEMGATPTEDQKATRRESDRFDPYFEHLLLIDRECQDPEIEEGVVGVYRLMRDDTARNGIGFYGQSEYELEPLMHSERRAVELGRSCVDQHYRGGAGMHMLWTGLGDYVTKHGISIMFGVASFHGSDTQPFSQALSYLHYNHLAPEDLRVRAVKDHFSPMNILAEDEVNRAEAMRQTPALIKAYIRLGGFVGEGAFIDYEFNTVDVCLLMDTARMVDRYRSFYSKRGGALDRIIG